MHVEDVRVLVVDGDRTFAESVRALLAESPGRRYLVTTATTAAQAGASLRAGAFDVAIVDAVLDDTDGVSLIRDGAARWPDRPFILITDVAHLDSRAIRAGASDYLDKASVRADLHRVLRHALERADARRAFAAADDRYGRLLRQSVSGIWSNRLDGSGLVANPAAAELLGYSCPEDLALINTADLFFDLSERAEFRRHLDRNGGVKGSEVRLRRKDGRPVWVMVNASVTRDHRGAIDGIEGTFLDITERKQLAQQLQQAQKMEAIGLLTGGIAHDFNNLLTAILGYTELADESLLPGSALREDLAGIKDAADRARSLVAQLLMFSRQQPPAARDTDIGLLLDGLARLIPRLIGEDVRLRLDVNAELWPVHADPNGLEQVIVNLAVNARDAMPRGGSLTIAASNTVLDPAAAERTSPVPTGEYVRISVTDTGEGMTEEVKAHLFEPFFTTKVAGRGTGLGLSTAYGIIRQSGGQIHAQSESGHGSTFTILLPRSAGAPIASCSTPELAPAGGTEAILLVEDDETVRRLTLEVLKRRGYLVVDAASAEEALELFRAGAVQADLLLTDVVMAGMRGPELASHLTALAPELRVLYMSGYTEDVLQESGIERQDISFIQKPFSASALLRAVREALEPAGKAEAAETGA